ncbi:MAG TPA: hypothetical protein VMW41_07090 [Candidatus Bathyarchaeia archaeon]|nr:hypothetical protein [Candidatus Bathyarchaeia archaeon]
MDFSNLINTINNLSLLQWSLSTFISVVVASVIAVKIVRYMYRKEQILYRNLKRPIKVFKPKNCTMDSEIGTLRKSGLFRIEDSTDDLRDIHTVTNHSILVVGYKKEMVDFEKFIKEVRGKNLPLIIYTFGDSRALSKELMDMLYTYPWYTISNTPLRLLSDVFTISSMYPYEK